MAVALAMNFRCDAAETPATWMDLSTAPTYTHKIDGLEKVNLDATSTPAVTKAWSDQRSLSAGTDTIDLTALAVPGQDAVDFSGLKVQVIKFYNRSGNSGAMEIAPDATNGYNIFGTNDDKVTVPVGGAIQAYLPEGNPDVAGGSADEITITGTGTDTYDILLVAG